MKIRKKCPICDTWYTLGTAEKKYLDIIKEDFPDKEDFWVGSWCPNIHSHYKVKLRKQIDSLPQSTRQKVLDLFRDGKKIGEIKNQLKLETMVVSQIICDNIECCPFLRTEAK